MRARLLTTSLALVALHLVACPRAPSAGEGEGEGAGEGEGEGGASGTDLGGGGAAIARLGGQLDVIACNFVHNVGNVDGQDTQGGAIFSEGGAGTTIVGSTFTNNSCSDGGALGALNSNLVVVNT